jgi:hypothetical protein
LTQKVIESTDLLIEKALRVHLQSQGFLVST